jgi:hypothetical protein
VARLDKDLRLIQATYLGGNYDDEASALAIHPQTGEIYVAGKTNSEASSITSGVVQTSNKGGYDAFVAKLSADLKTPYQFTYLGGSSDDYANALAISSSPTGEVEIYVAGYTYSNDFPNTSGGAQVSNRGSSDAFVVKLDKDLSLIQATYLGGNGEDEANALAIHSQTGEIYVVGDTNSKNFPKTCGGAQKSNKGSTDAFVARLNKELTKILQATYLGGSNDDHATALAISSSTGEVYVAGYTSSGDFPNISGGAQENYGGGFTDAFVARLNKDLTQIFQATYLGGSDNDYATALTISSSTGDVYVAGSTSSVDFPKTCDGAQESNNGSSDAFVARLTADLAAVSSSGSGSSSSTSSGGSGTVGGTGGGGGGGCSMTSSASSMAGVWNIFVWLSVPLFAVVRRIRKK